MTEDDFTTYELSISQGGLYGADGENEDLKVTAEDSGGGYFLIIKTAGFSFNPEDWPALRAAIDALAAFAEKRNEK